MKINQGTRFGTLEKPMFTVYLMCSFGLKKTKYFGLEFQRAIFEIINSLTPSNNRPPMLRSSVVCLSFTILNTFGKVRYF